MTALRGPLLRFVREDLLKGRNVPIDEHTYLFDQGLVDSLGILRLIAFLELQLGRSIDDREVVMEHFRTVRAIESRFGATDATDKRQATDATDATDKRQATDATDATDKRQATDATDATDKRQATDTTDATDKRRATDTTDATDKRRATGATDNSGPQTTQTTRTTRTVQHNDGD
ncbi:MAG TPA: phosphopantetheine-binding protein [Vicinamibacterales bacterium]